MGGRRGRGEARSLGRRRLRLWQGLRCVGMGVWRGDIGLLGPEGGRHRCCYLALMTLGRPDPDRCERWTATRETEQTSGRSAHRKRTIDGGASEMTISLHMVGYNADQRIGSLFPPTSDKRGDIISRYSMTVEIVTGASTLAQDRRSSSDADPPRIAMKCRAVVAGVARLSRVCM